MERNVEFGGVAASREREREWDRSATNVAAIDWASLDRVGIGGGMSIAMARTEVAGAGESEGTGLGSSSSGVVSIGRGTLGSWRERIEAGRDRIDAGREFESPDPGSTPSIDARALSSSVSSSSIFSVTTVCQMSSISTSASRSA